MGIDVSTDVDSSSSPITVSDTVSSSASSSAASAPTLRASAAAASVSNTTSTFCTPALATVWRRVSASDSVGQAEPCRDHLTARVGHRTVGADDGVGEFSRGVPGQVERVLVEHLAARGGGTDQRQPRHPSGDRDPEDYVHRFTPCLIDVPSYRTVSAYSPVESSPEPACARMQKWHAGVARPRFATLRGNRPVSDQRYDAPDTAVVATAAAAVVGRSPRVGYVPARANTVRDGVAVGLLAVALLLPWNLDFGVGIPVGNGLLIAVVVAVTLLAILAALAPHVGPFRLTAAGPECPPDKPDPAAADPRLPDRRRRLRRRISCSRHGAAAEPAWWGRASGPDCCSGSGARCSRRSRRSPVSPSRTTGFGVGMRPRGCWARVSIALATLSVAFNVYWRLRYLFVTNGAFGGEDIATIITTLLYGAEALIALVIASRWLTERTAAARLATAALGASGALAATLVWILPIGRDVDAFHGFAQNTSTAAVGYEGYLFWAAAAAIVAPTTLYAIFLIKPPTVGAYRSAAEKMPDAHRVLGVRRGRAAGHRLSGRLVTGPPPRPVRHRRDDGVQPDHRLDRAVAAPPTRQGRGHAARHRGVQRAAVRLHGREPRHRRRARPAVRRGVAELRLRQQPGPADHQHVRRDHLPAELRRAGRHAVHRAAGRLPGSPPREAAARPPLSAPQPAVSAPPTLARPAQPAQPPEMPRIVRLREDSTTVLAAPPTEEIAAPTAGLRILRRERASEPTIALSTPPDDADEHRPPSGPVTGELTAFCPPSGDFVAQA